MGAQAGGADRRRNGFQEFADPLFRADPILAQDPVDSLGRGQLEELLQIFGVLCTLQPAHIGLPARLVLCLLSLALLACLGSLDHVAP